MSIDLHDPKTLAALNSATKYPSILTLHGMGERGVLTDTMLLPWHEGAGELILTEKVDGTNARIVLMPDGTWLIGSREELLAAKGDIVHNKALGIVDALGATADLLSLLFDGQYDDGRIRVIYGELYGGKIGKSAKQYTLEGQQGFRVFDVAYIPEEVLDWDLENISAWREGIGQTYLDESSLQKVSDFTGLELTPRLGRIPVHNLTTSHEGVQRLLEQLLPQTQVGLDAHGKAEGIVLRTPDRRYIAKARFEDYERTFAKKARAK